MKIILEFNHDEAQMAEQAYRGPEYAMAVEDFRNFLRSKRKFDEMTPDAATMLHTINDVFHDIFRNLLND